LRYRETVDGETAAIRATSWMLNDPDLSLLLAALRSLVGYKSDVACAITETVSAILHRCVDIHSCRGDDSHMNTDLTTTPACGVRAARGAVFVALTENSGSGSGRCRGQFRRTVPSLRVFKVSRHLSVEGVAAQPRLSRRTGKSAVSIRDTHNPQ
jgi:hypothetical protein